MRIRKDLTSLSAEEKKAFIVALLRLKKDGRYDQYVHWHHAVMVPSVLPVEVNDPDYRNGAHHGPAFLPWHREMLMQVEDDLQRIDSHLTIPYWDWTEDAALDDPHKALIWQDDFMGGNGVESDEWRVGRGPFAAKTGNWPIPKDHGGPDLKRRFGFSVPTLPTKDDLKFALSEAYYDTPPFNSIPFTVGFRNRLEGWVTQRADSRIKWPGSQLHNRVHLWVGGSMEPMTSPNDPVFFLHHCFIDKVWADWQELQRQADQQDGIDRSPHYAPRSGFVVGHNLADTLQPWKRTIADVLEIGKLGYGYEMTTSTQEFLLLFKTTQPRSPFSTRRSPFAAD